VKESVVVVKENEAGDKRLIAYLVTVPDDIVETNTLRNQIKTKLPDYMVPSAFILLDEIPLTSNGKVDRAALLAFEQPSEEITQGYVGRNTAVEELLCDIWSEVLQVKPIGIHDNFFEIGGHP